MNFVPKRLILDAFIIIVYILSEIDCVSVTEDLSLTSNEMHVLAKFKTKVIPILPKKYMKSDIYLIRWLRARNFNIHLAEKMLKSNLRWRRDEKMDTIHQEDWSDLIIDYPYTGNTFDIKGRPIGTVPLGQWNFRQIAISGRMPRFQRYMNKLLDELYLRVIDEQYKGNNVTQAKVIFNMEGFNQIQQACPLCLPAYTSFISTYEERYAGYADEVIHVNTPPVYNIVLNLIRPIFAPATQKAFKIFNSDKNVWMKYLDKEISRSQRSIEYGGNKKD